MKSLYENPEVALLKFAAANVVTTSGGCDDDCSDDEGYEPSFGMGNCV